METTVRDRLKAFLAYKEIGQAKFAEAVGLSKGYVNNIVNSIQPKTLDRIAMQFPELNTAWLMTGEGDMIRPNYQQKVESGENFTQHGDVTVNQTNDEALLKALDEIAAQRRLTEKVTDQMNALIALLTRRGE
jgi:transcriptional regulator with XRE-family HTH domain